MKRLLSVTLMCLLVVSLLLPCGAVNTYAAKTYDYLFPVNNGGKIAYYYGYSKAYGEDFHDGIDIHSKGDDTIYAACGGKVVKIANSCEHVNYGGKCAHYKTYGNMIKVKQDDGTYAFYGHLRHNSLLVSKGDRIEKGQAIATMGSSGWSTGKHLHFEVRNENDKKINVNPVSKDGRVKYSKTGYEGSDVTYTSIAEGKYYLKNANNGEYLCVAGGTDKDGQNVKTATLALESKFILNLTKVSGSYEMRPLCSKNRLINNAGDHVGSGNNVNIWKDSNDKSQRWRFEKVDGGYVVRNTMAPICVLTVNSKQNVYLKVYNEKKSQIWKLQNAIQYNANGGSGAPGYQMKDYGVALTLSSKVPSRSGYVFQGWATDAAATVAKYSAGGTFTANANTKLYAVWKEKCVKAHSYRNGFCTDCGTANPNYTGVAKMVDGVQYYMKKGLIATSTTGLVKHEGIWYYVKKGKVATDVTNLVKYNGEWWYVVEGKVASNTTELIKYNNEWWYVVKGKIAAKTTGLVKYNGGWYYIYKGKMAAKTTTLVKNGSTWYYVRAGKVDFTYSGKVTFNGSKYTVKNGRVV